MRSTVTLASTLVIHPAVLAPTHCAVCALWGIERRATYFGQWDDQHGPDNFIGVCPGCKSSGFTYIGTIEEFKACQLRATGLAEYEVYGNDRERTRYMCSSRENAMFHIRTMIGSGISIYSIYRRSVNTQRLVKLNQDDQARIVIEAMEG